MANNKIVGCRTRLRNCERGVYLLSQAISRCHPDAKELVLKSYNEELKRLAELQAEYDKLFKQQYSYEQGRN